MNLEKIKQRAGDVAEHAANEFREETAKAYRQAEDAAEGLWARRTAAVILCALAVVCVLAAVVAGAR